MKIHYYIIYALVLGTALMITTSHQTFSSQVKFGQTNLLYNVNRNFIEFAKNNECPGNFQPLS